MAFPASTNTLGSALRSLQGTIAALDGTADNAAATLAASNVTADYVFRLIDSLRASLSAMDTMAATPGLVDYARNEFANSGLDIVAEYQTVRAKLIECRDWIITNFPKDANGWLLANRFNADGSRAPVDFTPAQTTTLRTRLQELAALIA